MTASVVIAARDEELVIGHALRTLLADAEEGEFDVVVVCNGCRDQTAAVARAARPDVRVLETPIAGKAAALNIGDAVAAAWPRVYVDADVRMATSSLRATVDALDDCLAAAPRQEWDLAGAGWAVRQYFEIRRRLPYGVSGHVGGGVYGLSEQGRRRFDAFPELIADDLYVQQLFTEDERRTVLSHTFVVTPPATLRGIVAEKTRVFRGNRQLARLVGRGPGAPLRWQLRMVALRLPLRLWPAAGIFVGVQVVAKLRARLRSTTAPTSWTVDAASRERLAAHAANAEPFIERAAR